MAIETKADGSLGCAYYSYEENDLYLLEDTRMADLDIVEQLLIHAQPTTLLLPMRCPESIQEYVKRFDGEASEGWSLRVSPDGIYYVTNWGLEILGAKLSSRLLESAEFSYEGALERILSLENRTGRTCTSPRVVVASSRADAEGGQECVNVRLMRLGSLINVDCRLSVRSNCIRPTQGWNDGGGSDADTALDRWAVPVLFSVMSGVAATP